METSRNPEQDADIIRPRPEVTDLQFEKAEFEEPERELDCTACRQAIHDSYFELNGKVLCPECKVQVEQALRGGSPGLRTIKAVVAGSLAAAAGAALWYGVRAATGMEIGLISIVVGIAVGMAVRWGAEHRGGWFYQALAMFLTYTSVAVTYLPYVAQGLFSEEKPAAVGTAGPSGRGPQGTSLSPAPEDLPEQHPPVVRAIALVLAAVVALAISYAAPFLAGFENILGLLIIAFGVWEAWRLNRRPKISIQGPLRLAAHG